MGAVCLTVQAWSLGTVRLPRLRLHPRARSGNIRWRASGHASGGGHRPAVVVYSGIFDATDLLSGFGGLIRRLAERIGTFGP
ncbi:MAG: hypothetical protein ACLRWP_18625 [Bilophila wadsworthia]